MTLVTIVTLLKQVPTETKRYHSFLRIIDKSDNEDIHKCAYLRKMSSVFARFLTKNQNFDLLIYFTKNSNFKF